MNKRGSLFLGVTIGIVIYIMGVMFLPFLINDIDTARDAFDCSSSTISDATKLNCLITNVATPYIIWFFVSLLLGFVIGVIK